MKQKNRLKICQWITPVVGAAIAFVIYLQEERRAKVERAVTVYENVIGLKSIENLFITKKDIEHLKWKKDLEAEKIEHEQMRIETKRNIPVVVFADEKIYVQREKIRHSVMDFLREAYLLYECGKFAPIARKDQQVGNVGVQKPRGQGGFSDQVQEIRRTPPKKNALCDRETMRVFFSDFMLELFYAFRPVIYCDNFFRGRYDWIRSPNGSVRRLEIMISEYLAIDMKNRWGYDKFFVFTTENEKNWYKHVVTNDNYAILRVSDERCELYPNDNDLQWVMNDPIEMIFT